VNRPAAYGDACDSWEPMMDRSREDGGFDLVRWLYVLAAAMVVVVPALELAFGGEALQPDWSKLLGAALATAAGFALFRAGSEAFAAIRSKLQADRIDRRLRAELDGPLHLSAAVVRRGLGELKTAHRRGELPLDRADAQALDAAETVVERLERHKTG
jgi:hypothetical protein